MTTIPVQDRIFEWLADPESLVDQFRVHVSKSRWRGMPSGVTPGTTTYEELARKCDAMPPAFLNEGTVKSYIFTRVQDSPVDGWFEFYFAASSTTTELTGETYTSPQPLPPDKFIESSVIESRSQIVPYGSSPDSASDVLESKVQPLDGVRSRMNTAAVLSYDGTPLYGWQMDPDTGKGYKVREQAVPAGTTGSAEVSADGEFSEVTPVNAWWSIKTTRKVTTLTNVPRTWTNCERSPVLWPAVLLSHDFLNWMDESYTFWHRSLFFTLHEPYNGDVLVDYSEWWQKSAPAPPVVVEMLPTAIRIDRAWGEAISIPECLHPAFDLVEELITGQDGNPGTFGSPVNPNLRLVRYNVPATNVPSWPDSVTKLDVTPHAGGFRCVKRVVYKPQSVVGGATITVLPYPSEVLITIPSGAPVFYQYA